MVQIGSRRRILVAVRPVVLEGALVALLQSADLGQIDHLGSDGEDCRFDRSRRYDAAIVTVDLVDAVATDVLIILPDTEKGPGTATVRNGNVTREVAIESHAHVLALLEEQFPCTAPAMSSAPTSAKHLLVAPVR